MINAARSTTVELDSSKLLSDGINTHSPSSEGEEQQESKHPTEGTQSSDDARQERTETLFLVAKALWFSQNGEEEDETHWWLLEIIKQDQTRMLDQMMPERFWIKKLVRPDHQCTVTLYESLGTYEMVEKHVLLLTRRYAESWWKGVELKQIIVRPSSLLKREVTDMSNADQPTKSAEGEIL